MRSATRLHITLLLPLLVLAGVLAGCTSSRESGSPAVDHYPAVTVRHSEEGVASYYSNRFHGRKTASGELYRRHELTAAHRDFPFGTWVRVTSLSTGRSVIVRINDRGPRKESRIIDVSYEAARHLDMVRDGLQNVRLDVLTWGETDSKDDDAS